MSLRTVVDQIIQDSLNLLLCLDQKNKESQIRHLLQMFAVGILDAMSSNCVRKEETETLQKQIHNFKVSLTRISSKQCSQGLLKKNLSEKNLTGVKQNQQQQIRTFTSTKNITKTEKQNRQWNLNKKCRNSQEFSGSPPPQKTTYFDQSRQRSSNVTQVMSKQEISHLKHSYAILTQEYNKVVKKLFKKNTQISLLTDIIREK